MTAELNAIIKTSKGDINLTLYGEKAPVTVANFVNLATRGYYNNLIFHRVIEDFMIQGGCPQGTGVGGPGYEFEHEIVDGLGYDSAGILAMANSGKDTNGSQFFITHIPTPHLDYDEATDTGYTIFGKIQNDADQNVVNSISKGDSIIDIKIEGDTAPLLESVKDRVEEWNTVLDT